MDRASIIQRIQDDIKKANKEYTKRIIEHLKDSYESGRTLKRVIDKAEEMVEQSDLDDRDVIVVDSRDDSLNVSFGDQAASVTTSETPISFDSIRPNGTVDQSSDVPNEMVPSEESNMVPSTYFPTPVGRIRSNSPDVPNETAPYVNADADIASSTSSPTPVGRIRSNSPDVPNVPSSATTGATSPSENADADAVSSTSSPIPVVEYYAFEPVEADFDVELYCQSQDAEAPKDGPLSHDPIDVICDRITGGGIPQVKDFADRTEWLQVPEFMRYTRKTPDVDIGEYKGEVPIIPRDDIDSIAGDAEQLRVHELLSASRTWKKGDDFIEHKRHRGSAKYIVCGDQHGGIHGLLRNLRRWNKAGIISDDWLVSEDYVIVFLGDLVDRGGYSFEVATTVLWLYRLNHETQRVWVVRGNHEDYNQGFQGIRGEELAEEYELPNRIALATKVLGVFHLFPSAIVLHFGTAFDEDGKKVLLVHGGICQALSLESSSAGVNVLDSTHAMALRWNDFRAKKDSIDNTRMGPEALRTGLFRQFGIDDVNVYRKSQGVALVLRGHQDFFNLQIMQVSENPGEDLFPVEPNNDILVSVADKLGDHFKGRFIGTSGDSSALYSGDLKYTGSFFVDATISSDSFQPVFTTSSARVRPHISSDSFLILRFDLDRERWRKDTGAFAVFLRPP